MYVVEKVKYKLYSCGQRFTAAATCPPTKTARKKKRFFLSLFFFNNIIYTVQHEHSFRLQFVLI